MSRRSSLQCSSPQQPNQSILHSPRLTTLSSLNTRTQRLGSQPTLFYSSNSTTKYLKPALVGGINSVKTEKMPQHLVDNPNQVQRQQRRSQPSIFAAEMHPQLMAIKSGPLGHSQPMLYFDYANVIHGSGEFMQPLLRTPPLIQRTQNSNSSSKTSSPGMGRKLPRLPPPERRVLRRSPQSDLFPRFQQHRHQLESSSINQFPNELIQTRLETNADGVDPIYLALKQATGKYGARRGSSNQFDSATPSPRNLSQVSLQDSGYAEATGSRGHLVGSTPQLHQTSQPPNTGAYPTPPNGISRPRAPKLNKQMKSLSLDCAESTPPISSGMRTQFKSKPIRQAHGFASGETSDWERSVSPTGPSPRRLPIQPNTQSNNQLNSGTALAQQPVLGTHIVTHEYTPPDGTFALYLGDRLRIIDTRDNDWFHGFRTNDRLQQLLTFPSTCVAGMQPQEQPMKLIQNAHIAEAKLRFYRDQVVFAQPDSMRNNSVLVRNERGSMAYCPLQFLMLL